MSLQTALSLAQMFKGSRPRVAHGLGIKPLYRVCDQFVSGGGG